MYVVGMKPPKPSKTVFELVIDSNVIFEKRLTYNRHYNSVGDENAGEEDQF